jgi:hypothetical protein
MPGCYAWMYICMSRGVKKKSQEKEENGKQEKKSL